MKHPDPYVYRPLWTHRDRRGRAVRGVLLLERAAARATDPAARFLLTNAAADRRRAMADAAAGAWLGRAALHLRERGAADAAAVIERIHDAHADREQERAALAHAYGYGPERAPWRHCHELHPQSVASRANASWWPVGIPAAGCATGLEARVERARARLEALAQA